MTQNIINTNIVHIGGGKYQLQQLYKIQEEISLLMQSISKYPLIRLALALLTVGLIATAIAFEFLAEDLAKVFVIPILVSVLFTSIAQASIYKKY